MKILAIGDFHGKFPAKLQKEAKKADFIISQGDFADTGKIRKIIFKCWTTKYWADTVGKKKARELEKEGFDSGFEVLKKLNSLGKKVFIIWGNCDFYKGIGTDELAPGTFNDKIKNMKNIVLVERKKKKINSLEIAGFGGYLDITDYIKHPIDEDKKKQKRRLKRYKKFERELFEIFRKKKPKKNFILLIHYTPYKILDKIKNKESPMHGRNAGFEPYNKIIKKYKPILAICGHMHEYQGMKKLGKTTIINPGPAYKGKAALIDIEGQKIKSVKFLK